MRPFIVKNRNTRHTFEFYFMNYPVHNGANMLIASIMTYFCFRAFRNVLTF